MDSKQSDRHMDPPGTFIVAHGDEVWEDFMQCRHVHCTNNLCCSDSCTAVATHKEMRVQYLSAFGASHAWSSLQTPDKYGITPLLAAIYEGHATCVELLLSKVSESLLVYPSSWWQTTDTLPCGFSQHDPEWSTSIMSHCSLVLPLPVAAAFLFAGSQEGWKSTRWHILHRLRRKWYH